MNRRLTCHRLHTIGDRLADYEGLRNPAATERFEETAERLVRHVD